MNDTPAMEAILAQKTELKTVIEAKKSELDAVADEWKAHVRKLHVDEAYLQLEKAAERDGRTMHDEAVFWLTEENADDPGHRIQAGLYLKSEGTL